MEKLEWIRFFICCRVFFLTYSPHPHHLHHLNINPMSSSKMTFELIAFYYCCSSSLIESHLAWSEYKCARFTFSEKKKRRPDLLMTNDRRVHASDFFAYLLFSLNKAFSLSPGDETTNSRIENERNIRVIDRWKDVYSSSSYFIKSDLIQFLVYIWENEKEMHIFFSSVSLSLCVSVSVLCIVFDIIKWQHHNMFKSDKPRSLCDR